MKEILKKKSFILNLTEVRVLEGQYTILQYCIKSDMINGAFFYNDHNNFTV